MRDKLIELIHNGVGCPDGRAPFGGYCEGCKYFPSLDCNTERLADYLIANGVTIAEPAKHGWWEDYVNIKGVVRCSECHDTYIYKEWVNEGKWYYCPNCGAKMEVEDTK